MSMITSNHGRSKRCIRGLLVEEKKKAYPSLSIELLSHHDERSILSPIYISAPYPMSASSSDIFQEAQSGGGSDAEFTECLEASEEMLRRLECGNDSRSPLQDPGVLELVANNSFRKSYSYVGDNANECRYNLAELRSTSLFSSTGRNRSDRSQRASNLGRARSIDKTDVQFAIHSRRVSSDFGEGSLSSPSSRNHSLRVRSESQQTTSAPTVIPSESSACCLPTIFAKRIRRSDKVRTRVNNKPQADFQSLRLIESYTSHAGPIWTARFSLDGRFLATAGRDMKILVWSVGKFPKIVYGSTYDKFSEDYESESSSVTEDNKMKTELIHKSPYHVWRGHTSDVLDLSWSESHFMLSASADKTVRLWSIFR